MTISSSTSAESMIASFSRSVLSRRLLTGAAALSLCALGSCKTSDILAADSPDILTPGGLTAPGGATPLRYGMIRDFVQAFDGIGDNFVIVTGNLADELRASDTFDGRLLPNKRAMNDNLPEMNTVYLALHKARTDANVAIKIIKVSAPTPTFNIGELYMYRGYTEDFFGEMYCSGVPFSESDGTTTILGKPETTVQVFTRSAASFDSALTLADTSQRVKYGAAVGKARALLNLGQYAAAAAAVTAVPTTFKLASDHCIGSGCTENGVYGSAAASNSRYTPSKNEGINGLDFLPAVADPRLPWQASTRSGFNTLWAAMPVPLKPLRAGVDILADGIEARLIEAEARLQGGAQADRDAVYQTLNTLRSTAITPAIPAIAGGSPTTQDAAITMLFNERAYWMYLTGHRLGDLRRLIRQYNRNSESVFPTGEQQPPISGPYGTDVNYPVPALEKNNPNFTGCIDRKA